MDLLNLSSLKALSVEETGGAYAVGAEATPPSACSHCGTVGELVGFGRRAQVYADLPIHAKRVTVTVNRRRWKCKACSRISLDPLPDMDEKRDATKRLVGYIQAQSLRRTFTSIAEEVGVDEKTIRNVFADYVAYLDETVHHVTPRVLGLDELHLLGRARAVITNVEERTAFGLLENRDYQTIYRYLMWLPQKYRVEVVVIDMWRPYANAIRDAFQGRDTPMPVVIDKFHVVRMANAALEGVRKDIKRGPKDPPTLRLMRERHLLLRREGTLNEQERMRLEVWLNQYPQLGTAHRLKEDFYAIWDSATKAEALERYAAWQAAQTIETAGAYRELMTAMRNWETEIFAYFDHPVTNAYTEALNGVARVTDRMGRGYSFDVIRAKVLYSKGTHPRPDDKHIQHYRPLVREEFADYAAQVEREVSGSYGTDLSTLREILERAAEKPESTRQSE